VQNAATIREIFDGKPGPPHDIVVANAAAALVAANVASSFLEGAQLAAAALASGAARAKLEALVDFTNRAEREGTV
jgi:anthranilate phosphoribosyltransferase